MSKAVAQEVEQEVPEAVVRNRSRHAKTLHRPDPESVYDAPRETLITFREW